MSSSAALLSDLTRPQLELVLALTDSLCDAPTYEALLAAAGKALIPVPPFTAGALLLPSREAENANRSMSDWPRSPLLLPAGGVGNGLPNGAGPTPSSYGPEPVLLPVLLFLAGHAQRRVASGVAPAYLTLTFSAAHWHLADDAGQQLADPELTAWVSANSEVLAALLSVGYRQLTCCPLRHKAEYLGALLLGATQVVSFTAATRSYLRQAAAPIVRALHGLRVGEQHAARQRQQELLFALGEQAVRVRDVQDLFRVLFRQVQPVLKFHDAAVILRSADGQHYRHLAIFAEQDLAQPLPRAVTGRVSPVAGSPHEPFFAAAQPAPLLLDAADVHRRYPAHWETRVNAKLGFRQRFWLPLRVPGRLLGTLEFVSDQAHFFTPDDFPLAQAIADLLAGAVGNLLANEEIEGGEREKTWQLAVATALVSIKDRVTLAKALVQEINQAVPCHYAELYFGGPLSYPEATWQLRREAAGHFAVLPADEAALRPSPDPALAEAEAQVPAGVYVGQALEDLAARLPRLGQLHAQCGVEALLKLALPPTRHGEGSYLLLASRTPYAYTPADAQRLELLLPPLCLALDNLAAFEQIETLSQQLAQDKTYLVEEIQRAHNYEEIVGSSPALQHVLRQVQLVAPTDATVLISGETGTGKELIARALHHYSPRRDRVLVKVNCAALPPQLIESELFGHEKGAFTGATERRIGKFELAHGGTIFLDEIGELPPELQAKLLRVLQGREFERIGGKTTITADFRVVAATNRDLKQEMAAGRFRADLYYRLSTFPLLVPPLRERPEDIPLLAQFFARKFAKRMGRPFRGIQDAALRELRHYAWPGNIRELENVVEQAVIVCGGAPLQWARPLLPFAAAEAAESARLALPSLRPPGPYTEAEKQRIFAVLRETKGKIVGPQGAAQRLGVYPGKLHELEREFLLALLDQSHGRIRGEHGAATRLGVKPTTLEARLKKLGLARSSSDSA